MSDPTDDEVKARSIQLCEAEHGFAGGYKTVSHEPLAPLTEPELERRRVSPGSQLVMTDGLPEWSDRWRLYRREAHRQLLAEKSSP